MGSQLKMSYSREQTLVRTQPTAKPGLKTKPGQQNPQGSFDPEELTRRLYIVLADRRAHEERKRTRQHEDAKLKDARSWTSRHHSNKEAAGRRSKEATRETATAQPFGRQISLRPIGSSSSERVAKQRKDAAPPSEPTAGSSYHHIPQEAAKQFQRTTTVAPMRESSSSTSNILQTKLSKQALKLHLASASPQHSHPQQAHPIPDATPISPVLNHYLHTHTRVDEWRSRIPEDALDEEEREEYHLAPQHQHPHQDPSEQHTFAAELAKLKPPPTAQNNNNRRNSTGDILASPPTAETCTNRLSLILPGRTSLADVLESPPTPPPDPVCADEHRVDWTQSDESQAQAQAQAQRAAAAAEVAAAAAPPQPVPQQQRQHKPLLLTPLLRKADSIWTLRGRLGSGSGGGTKSATREQQMGQDMEKIVEKEAEKADKGSQTSSKSNKSPPRGEPRSPPGRDGAKEPRSPMGGFFAKFKR